MSKTERSPNYPQHGLSPSIDFARVIYAKEKMGEAPGEVIAHDLGHESLNGAARVKIASMRQYGLLDGRGDKLRLTDRAFQILESPHPDEVLQATTEAAYSPSLFAEIRANKLDASDEAISYWLRREKQFSTEGANRAVRAYRETTASLGLAGMGYTKGDEPEQKPPPPREERPSGGQPAPHPKNDSGASRHNVTGLLLEGGTTADVGFSGQPLTREGVDMLIDYFKLLRRALPVTPAPTSTADVPPSESAVP